MDITAAASLLMPLITTAITPRKIIAGVIVLVVIGAAVVWFMSRSRSRGTN